MHDIIHKIEPSELVVIFMLNLLIFYDSLDLICHYCFFLNSPSASGSIERTLLKASIMGFLS